MAIIAINQQLGSRGDELGKMVARELGYRFVARNDLVARASEEYKVNPAQFLIVDERQPGFWERSRADTDRLHCFLRAVLMSEFARDNVVYAGIAGVQLLPESGCGLRVRTIGTVARRIERIAQEEKLSQGAAERRVREHDREVRARAQSLTGIDIEDPCHYHLMINTSEMALEPIVKALAAAAREIETRATAEGRRVIRDAAIAEIIRAGLLAHPKFGHAQIEVACRNGAVQINGPGLVPPWDEMAERLARNVDGVASVTIGADQPSIALRAE